MQNKDQNFNKASAGIGETPSLPADPGAALNENISENAEHNNPGKSSKLKIIVFVIIGVFVLGGLAYGAWYGYENYYKAPRLADLIFESVYI